MFKPAKKDKMKIFLPPLLSVLSTVSFHLIGAPLCTDIDPDETSHCTAGVDGKEASLFADNDDEPPICVRVKFAIFTVSQVV